MKVLTVFGPMGSKIVEYIVNVKGDNFLVEFNNVPLMGVLAISLVEEEKKKVAKQDEVR